MSRIWDMGLLKPPMPENPDMGHTSVAGSWLRRPLAQLTEQARLPRCLQHSLICSRRKESAVFESALVESSGKLKSKSRYWMLATFAFNLIVLTVMVLIPLLNPEALPKTALAALLTAPPPPPPAAPPAPTHVMMTKAVAALDPMTAPTHVPRTISMANDAPPPVAQGVVSGSTMGADNGAPGGVFTGLGLTEAPVVVTRQPEKPKQTGPVRVSSGVAAGQLLTKTTPTYPAIAKAAHVSGAVVLHAIISKSGTIESLQVVSGPEMLRASALDAVRQWHYKPYLLNGEPTEVDTAVTVNFSFGG